jgi:multicomponent Na+:H+ antiporter subunit C
VEVVTAVAVGILFASAIFLMLRRSLMRLIVGLAIIGHAVNLMIFSSGGVSARPAPLVDAGALMPVAGHADPLPQALVLTAIVISFGMRAFTVILVLRSNDTFGSDDVDKLRRTES